MRRILSFIIHSNLYVVAVIYALLLTTDLVISGKAILSPAHLFILSGTLFLYPVHRLYAVYQNPHSSLQRINSANGLKIPIMIIAGIGILGSIWFMFQTDFVQIVAMVPVAIIGLLYTFSLRPYLNVPPLREVPVIKPFIIALVVSYATTIPAYIHTDLRNAAFLFLLRFFFIAAVTIPFDIRDIRIDQLSNMKTPAVILGEKKSKAVALLINALFTGGCFFAYYFFEVFPLHVFVAFWMSEIFASYMINKCSSSRSNYYFIASMEGSIVLQAVLVGVAVLLFGL